MQHKIICVLLLLLGFLGVGEGGYRLCRTK